MGKKSKTNAQKKLDEMLENTFTEDQLKEIKNPKRVVKDQKEDWPSKKAEKE